MDIFASLRPSCPSCWPSCPSCWPSWRQHVPQVLSRCPKNAILEPTSPNKCFRHLFKHPQIPENLWFFWVFVGFLLSSPCAQIVPKCSQHAPKTSQVEPDIANLAPTLPLLRPFSRQPAQNFSENRAQDAQNAPRSSRNCSKTRFSSHCPLQAPQNNKKPMFSLCFCKFSAIQPMCQNSPKMLTTCSQNLPS